MTAKKYNEKIREVIKRRAEEKREQDRNKFSKDYAPKHPDNR